MKELNYNKELIFCAILFTIHNIEESVGYAYFTFPENIKLPFNIPSVPAMVGAIVTITVIAWLIFLFIIRSKNANHKRDLLSVVATMFLVNALVPHITSSIILHRYTPAVVTSVLLYLPYAFVVLPRLYKSYNMHMKFFKVVLAGVFLLTLFTAGLQIGMKFIFK